MQKNSPSALEQYVLRRVLHTGRFRRRDLKAVSDDSDSTQSRFLDLMCNRYADLMYRDRRCYRPHAHVHLSTTHPHSANSILNDLLLRKASGFELGIDVRDQRSPKGVSVEYGMVRAQQLPNEVDYSPLLQGLIHKQPFDARYVSRSLNACARWRCIMPVALYRVVDQLILTGYDLDEIEIEDLYSTQPKQFSLFRMLDVRYTSITPALREKVDVIANSGLGRQLGTWYVVTLNPKLTDDQKLAATRELGLDSQGRILLDSVTYFHFIQRHAIEKSPSQSANQHVSPLVTRVERLA